MNKYFQETHVLYVMNEIERIENKSQNSHVANFLNSQYVQIMKYWSIDTCIHNFKIKHLTGFFKHKIFNLELNFSLYLKDSIYEHNFFFVNNRIGLLILFIDIREQNSNLFYYCWRNLPKISLQIQKLINYVVFFIGNIV